MRLPLIVVALAAAVFPAHSLAAEAAEFRGWVHGYGMRIGPGSMLDGLSAEKRRVNIQLIEQLHGKPLDAEGMRHYFSAPRILELDPDGPAARAGLNASDMLTHIYENVDKYDSDTSRVRSPDEALAVLDRFRTGRTVTLDGLRNDKLVQFKVTVGVRRRVKDFRGVSPGETTIEELRINGEWGKPVREDNRGSGITLWEYKIAPWSKVFALIEDDVVRAMDFVPPPSTGAERIRNVVGLGELVPLKSLPPSARVGRGDIGEGHLLAAEEIYAIMLTDRPGERANVKLVRLYSPGTARTESPALKYVPASSNLIFGFDVGSLARDPRIMSLVAKFETAESVKFARVFGRERWIDAIDRAVIAFQVDTAQIDAEAYQPPGTLILNMRTSVDLGKLLEAEEDAFTRVQHRGKVYYQGEDLSLYFPNDRTILGANLPDEQFVSIVESGGSRPSLPPQTMAAVRALPPADVWFVMPYKTVREKLEAALHEDENFAGFAPAQNVVERLREVETVAGWAKLEGDQLRLTVSLACTGTSGAERLAEAQRIFFDLAKSLVEAQEEAGGDAPTPLGRELIETFRIHTEGTRVLLSTEWNVDSFLAEAVPNAQ